MKITAGPPHPSRYTAVDPVPGAEDLLARVGQLVADLSPDNADLLPAFHRIQHEFGYVPKDVIPLIATKFRTTPAMIYGALDFYSEIRTSPPAETIIEWCSGPACLLKGSMNVRRALEAVLGCQMNENTADGKLGLRLIQSDGTCHLAPLVRINGRYIGPLTTSDAVKLARELSGREVGEPKATPGGRVEAVPAGEDEWEAQRARTEKPLDEAEG